MAFGVLLGEIVPRFDLVMSMIGSTLTGPLMFILPPLFYGKLLKLKKQMYIQDIDQESNDETLSCYDDSHYFEEKFLEYEDHLVIPFEKIDIFLAFLIICFGIVITFIATYYNWMNVIQYAQFKPSCLINATTNFFMSKD